MILVPSKHLVKVKINNEITVIYNSLLGKLLQTSPGTVRFLDRHKAGIPMKNGQPPASLAAHRQTIDKLSEFHILVPKGKNEYKLFMIDPASCKKEIMAGAYLSNLRLEIAGECNFRCQHCFYPKVYGWQKSAMMSVSVAKRAVDGMVALVKRQKSKHLTIMFFGGEPLLNWKTVKWIVKYGRAIEKKLGIHIDFGIFTNGSLITDAIAAFAKRNDLPFGVSLDGLKEDNDRFRTKVNGAGTFELVTRGLDILKKHGVDFRVELSLNKYNYYNVEKFIDFLVKRYDVKRLVVAPVTHQKDGSSFDNISSRDKARRIMQLYAHGEKRGVHVSGNWEGIVRNSSQDKFFPLSCDGMRSWIYVKHNGDVAKCTLIPTIVGHVDHIERIPRNPRYVSAAIRSVSRIKGCRGCSLEGMCAGGCAGVARYYSNDIYDSSHPDFQRSYCDFLREVHREYIKYTVTKNTV